MTSSQLRTVLNSAAGACTAAATAVVALGYPVPGLALGSLATFFLGWANFTKPGDTKKPAPDDPPITTPDPPKAGPA